MINKTTIAALVAIAVATSLAVVPAALTNQALAFPGENGQGHQRTQECTQGPPREECPGNSETNNPNRDECTTTYAGNSNNIKFTDCPP
jgi:hypothetical protein